MNIFVFFKLVLSHVSLNKRDLRYIFSFIILGRKLNNVDLLNQFVSVTELYLNFKGEQFHLI